MATNGFKVKNSINLVPQSSQPQSAADGDIYFDVNAHAFAVFRGGIWQFEEAVTSVGAQSIMTSSELNPSILRYPMIHFTGTTAGQIHGLASAPSGRQVVLYNGTTVTQVLKNQSATEPVALLRITTPTGSDMNLNAGEAAHLVYDSGWLVVSITSNGTQAVASTSNNGLVTLRTASATPTAPTVLTDGDVDIANGVAKLDASKNVLGNGFKYESVVTKVLHLEAASLQTDGLSISYPPNDYLGSNNTGTHNAWGNFRLPSGSTITKLEVLMSNVSGATAYTYSLRLGFNQATAGLYTSSFIVGSSGALQSLTLPANSSAAWINVTPLTSLAGPSDSLGSDGYYYFQVNFPSTTGTGDLRLYGTRITYTFSNVNGTLV